MVHLLIVLFMFPSRLLDRFYFDINKLIILVLFCQNQQKKTPNRATIKTISEYKKTSDDIILHTHNASHNVIILMTKLQPAADIQTTSPFGPGSLFTHPP